MISSVIRVNATQADWTFAENVAVLGTTTTLKINSNSPSVSLQQAANVVRNTYVGVSSGMAWTSTAPEVQLSPPTAANQSGTVP